MISIDACVAAEDGSAMTQPRRDLILHRPERAMAEEFGLTLEEVQQVLDEHPVERDRDTYLRRALAQQLLLLDRLEITFGRRRSRTATRPPARCWLRWQNEKRPYSA
jgi:hypothetical protein